MGQELFKSNGQRDFNAEQHVRMRGIVSRLYANTFPRVRKKEVDFLCNRIARALRKTGNDVYDVEIRLMPFELGHWSGRYYAEFCLRVRKKIIYLRYICD